MTDEHPKAPDWNTDTAWRSLSTRIARAERRRRTVRGVGIALSAAAALLVVAKLAPRDNRSAADAPFEVASTKPGERRAVTLADGTRIDLAPATTVRYRLTRTARDVELEGLAQFTVTHNAERPFRVRARNTITEDIGTVFHIRAYPTDSAVQVAVAEGRVDVSTAAKAPLQLDAGAAAIVGADNTPRLETTGVAKASAGWINGSLTFRNAALGDVARDLSRWFGIEIRVPASTTAPRITANYATPEITAVLDAISAATHLRYTRTGDTVKFLGSRQ